MMGPDIEHIQKCIKQIQNTGLKLTIENGITDFLGVQFLRSGSQCRETQPQLIEMVLKELNLQGADVNQKKIPMASSKILTAHPESPNFDENFHYRRVVGMLNFLQKCTRPDLSYTLHQCACFCENPKVEHGNTLKWIGRYLNGTRDRI